MMTIEVTTYKEERESSDERIEVGPCFRIVWCKWMISVWWSVQYTYNHEMGVEGKP